MRGLILGFDGVLVDERPVQAELLRQVFADEGLEDVGDRALEAFAFQGAADLPSLIQEALERGDAAAPGLAPRLAARWAAFYQMRRRQEGHRVAAGALAAVERAVDSDWMLGVLSPSPEAEIFSALDQLEIREHFKSVSGNATLSADAYREVWRALNSLPPLPSRLLHPHEVIVVDTAPQALAAAAEAGLVTVGLPGRYDAEHFEAADRVLDDLQELFTLSASSL